MMAQESGSVLARLDRPFTLSVPKPLAFGLGQLVGLLGYLALPVTQGFLPGINGTLVFRGILAGAICGLGAAGFSGAWAAGGATVAALLGALVMLASVQGISAGMVALSVLLAAAVAFGAAWAVKSGLKLAVVGLALATLFVMVFWIGGFVGGPYAEAVAPFHQKIATEPVAEQYGFDGEIFLKTYYLVNSGMPYYEAFTKAYIEDSRLNNPPLVKIGYREPLLYWVWALLPGASGVALLGWFCALACGAMAAAYFLAERFVTPAAALLAPASLVGYFVWPTTSTWFTINEYWAGAVGLICVALLARNKWIAGAVLLLAAAAVRELMVYLIPVFVIAWALYPERRKALPALAIGVIGPIVAVALHLRFAPQNSPTAGSFDLSTWLNGGWSTLANALKFSGDFALAGSGVQVWLVVAAIAGALFVAKAWRKALLFLAVVVPATALALFAMNEWQYYWGPIMMPIALAIAPVVFAPLLPAEQAADGVVPATGKGSAAKGGNGKTSAKGNKTGKGKRAR